MPRLVEIETLILPIMRTSSKPEMENLRSAACAGTIVNATVNAIAAPLANMPNHPAKYFVIMAVFIMGGPLHIPSSPAIWAFWGHNGRHYRAMRSPLPQIISRRAGAGDSHLQYVSTQARSAVAISPVPCQARVHVRGTGSCRPVSAPAAFLSTPVYHPALNKG